MAKYTNTRIGYFLLIIFVFTTIITFYYLDYNINDTNTLSTTNLEKIEHVSGKMFSPEKPTKLTELKSGMLFVAFEENTSESDIISVFKNYNLMKEYNVSYNVSGFRDFYIFVSADNYFLIKPELERIENWRYADVTQKGDTYFIVIPTPGTLEKKVNKILENHNMSLEKFIWARIDYGRNTKNWIDEQNATKIKAELESDENVLMVVFDYVDG